MPKSGYKDEELIALIESVDKVGIDSPLGWPDPFVAALTAHRERMRWTAGADRVPLKYRATDLVVKERTGRFPLSVSTDRLGVTAMRCAHVLELLAARNDAADRAGSGLIVEVYPAAALRVWGLDPTGYKAKDGQPARAALLGALERELAWETPMPEAMRKACEETDHALDAFISALVARAAARQQTDGPGELADRAQREGWIHLPNAGLGELVGS